MGVLDVGRSAFDTRHTLTAVPPFLVLPPLAPSSSPPPPPKMNKLGGVYMRKLATERVSYWDIFFISYRVYIMTGSFHISLLAGTLHFDKIHVRFKIANIIHAPPVPVYQQTNFTPKRLVVSHFHDTILSTTTGVNSCRGDSRRHDILWCYHVNKCRAMRGNPSELTLERKSPRCHVNTPLLYTEYPTQMVE